MDTLTIKQDKYDQHFLALIQELARIDQVFFKPSFEKLESMVNNSIKLESNYQRIFNADIYANIAYIDNMFQLLEYNQQLREKSNHLFGVTKSNRYVLTLFTLTRSILLSTANLLRYFENKESIKLEDWNMVDPFFQNDKKESIRHDWIDIFNSYITLEQFDSRNYPELIKTIQPEKNESETKKIKCLEAYILKNSSGKRLFKENEINCCFEIGAKIYHRNENFLRTFTLWLEEASDIRLWSNSTVLRLLLISVYCFNLQLYFFFDLMSLDNSFFSKQLNFLAIEFGEQECDNKN